MSLTNRKKFFLSQLLLLSLVLIFFLSFTMADDPETALDQLRDPYLRPRHGPPLTNVVHKVNLPWLYKWLKNPQSHDASAKMPNLQLEDREIEAIISYLNSIADSPFPRGRWDTYLLKDAGDLTDKEWEQLERIIAEGKKVWGQARCTICHSVEGRGGFVNLGVAKSLSGVAGKVNRDWLYQWIKRPQAYFPETLMPRFRLSDDEAKTLVEYILRADPFRLSEEDSEDEDEPPTGVAIKTIAPSPDSAVIALGKRTIELSRCILCHNIKGIKEIMPVAEQQVSNKSTLMQADPSDGFFELLNDVRCLTCHTIAGKGGDYAPELTYEGSKLRSAWLTDFLKSPDIIRPLSQQMPKFNLTDAEAKTAVQFIKGNLLRPEMDGRLTINPNPARNQIGAGEKIFYDKGCHACHSIAGKGGALGPELTNVGDRLEPSYIVFHLKDPNRAVSFSPEPNYGLSDEEALALTYFFSCPGKSKNKK